jgi:hypothetical protein
MLLRIWKKSNSIPKAKFFWADPLTKKLEVFDCHNIKYQSVEEEFVEFMSGEHQYFSDIINEVIEYNLKEGTVLTKEAAEKIVRENCVIKKINRMKVFPVIYEEEKTKDLLDVAKEIFKIFKISSKNNENDYVLDLDYDKSLRGQEKSEQDEKYEDFFDELERNRIFYAIIEE